MIGDMSLGEYIKHKKSSGGRGRGRGGADRGRSQRPGLRRSGGREQAAERPAKPEAKKAAEPQRQLLIVESLPTSVTNEQLNELFGKVGTLTRCNVLYDVKGVSKVR